MAVESLVTGEVLCARCQYLVGRVSVYVTVLHHTCGWYLHCRTTGSNAKPSLYERKDLNTALLERRTFSMYGLLNQKGAMSKI